MNTKVTIGLCVKNGEKVVKTAFESISIQDYPHKSMKLVIVDDCSSDNTLSLASEFAQETDIQSFVTSSKGNGLAATRQIVVDNAEGDYLLWVDDDLVLPRDYIRTQVEFMDKNLHVGATRGFIDEFSNKHVFRFVDFESLVFEPTQTITQLGTGGSIFRLKALEEVGGFDIRIKGAAEDIDVSRRIWKSGWTLAANKSACLHNKYPAVTLNAFWNTYFKSGYGNHFIFHKYKDLGIIIPFFPPFALLSGFKVSIKIYRVTNMKKAFAFSILDSFSKLPLSIGFIRAHFDGYGHQKHLG